MNTVIVKSSRFNAHYPVDIPKNTVNAEAVLIRLDSEWDNLTVRIHWLNVASNAERKTLLERDQPNTIPWEVLTDLGELRMGLVGMDGDTVIKPTIWLSYGYVSDGVDPESGSDPQPPTPSWEQKMVALAEAAANAAKAAKETADNLQAAAEAGEFNGDPGLGLPTPTKEDAGKFPVVNPDGDGYELRKVEGGGATQPMKLVGSAEIKEEVAMADIPLSAMCNELIIIISAPAAEGRSTLNIVGYGDGLQAIFVSVLASSFSATVNRSIKVSSKLLSVFAENEIRYGSNLNALAAVNASIVDVDLSAGINKLRLTSNKIVKDTTVKVYGEWGMM